MQKIPPRSEWDFLIAFVSGFASWCFLLGNRFFGNHRCDLAAVNVPGLSFRILGIRIVDAYPLDLLPVVVLAGDAFHVDAAQ